MGAMWIALGILSVGGTTALAADAVHLQINQQASVCKGNYRFRRKFLPTKRTKRRHYRHFLHRVRYTTRKMGRACPNSNHERRHGVTG